MIAVDGTELNVADPNDGGVTALTVILVIFLQYANALPPILVTLSGIVNSVKALHE